ncbi:RB1-inducible coiled-coil protein 1-like [Uloborus diversus]|uniref:RB1-inducible coiled-coil protein 1-like n=1 Tax=Uloborus diversus TaxID=327109 RepID=UPI00240A4DD1|nr:RB1-inducible coiled-coil protein 1-like [Uloborus diversus]
MLYVFVVSTGTMMKFDMNLAVKKVIELKIEISKYVEIAVEDQVLLCSGGEELKSDNIVGNYFGAGTDTNPIFLFNKYVEPESQFPYDVPLRTSIDLSIENDVRACANMSPSSNAATVMSALAQKFADAAVNGRRECDELVHGQHLQQQGWAAVIANLEDAKDSLMKRWSYFQEMFQKYLANRSGYKEIIQTFPDDIELLSKVPLLPKLMLGNECIEEDIATEHTLLSWFCSEPRQYLEALAEKCQYSLDEIGEHSLLEIQNKIAIVLADANKPTIKEVKGIEERLSLLNRRIEDAKKYEKDQRNLANWFNQTQGRISRDPQVLPDLCGTFQIQLELMLENHKCLGDILDRCSKAKTELTESINSRVKYICGVESNMYNLQVEIIFLEKRVRSLTSQIESFQQVHLAPQRYLKMLAEVCRRKVFSSNFMKWATDLSAQACKLYDKEISLRNSFGAASTKNMVDNLFPGMDDVPPPFAIECPRPFDQNLPNIVKEDLEVLRIRLPELSPFCEVPAPDPMPYISQVESDSAFSSNIPSSRIAGESAESGQKSLPDKSQSSPQKLAAPSTDYSSLPSEFASLPNEVFSLTSSPFEDPLSHAVDLELAKRTSTPPAQSDNLLNETKSPAEEHVTVESDGEEFETVEQYGTSPIEICPKPSQSERSVFAPRPTSSSDVINVNKVYDDSCPKVSKACSDGDALSPIQERLKSSESLVVSGDYYFDDSMPSSCTESNATSPLIRANKMVKTHHVIVAELQKQVEEKDGALVGASSSLKNSRSNILKLHAKISALQRFIQELQGSLRSDLSNLKAFVKEEIFEGMSEVSQIVENINTTMVQLHQQMLSEKEEALNKIRDESSSLENTFLQRLEVESQKLTDAENQVSYYEEHLRQLTSSLADLRHEKEQLESAVSAKDEKISSMMLEHELELDSLRNLMKQKLQDQDDNVLSKTEELAETKAVISRLHSEKRELEEKIRENDLVSANMLHQQELDFCEKLKDVNELQEKVEKLQEVQKSCKTAAEVDVLCRDYEKQIDEFKRQLSESQNSLATTKAELEESKKHEIQALEEKHKNEIQSLISRYKLAVSTTSIDRVPSNINLENLEPEAVIGTEDVKKIISEERNKWESEKEKKIASIRIEYEDSLEKLRARYTAENQVSFNKAINRLTKEKDAVIEELRSKISILEAKNGAIKAHLDKCALSFEFPAQSVEAVLSQSDSSAANSSHGSSTHAIFSKLRQELEPYFQLTESLSLSSEGQESIEILRKKLKLKEEEFEKLATKFIHVAGSRSRPSYSCNDCKHKISIFSCEVGDLILICYEEKHENFIVFHLGNYQHFLHTDSFQALNLKIPIGSSERWAVGTITSKEFCITKKLNNRYKVGLGTKFYRVKVKPWDRDKALEEFELHHNKVDPNIYVSRISSVLPEPHPAEDTSDASGASHMSASAI